MLTALRSRKHIAPFALLRPASIEECCTCLAQPGRVALMAGGLDLIDRMKAGAIFDRVVSLAGIPELSGIRDSGDAIVMGALTTHAAITQDVTIAERLADLSLIWRQIANPRVRYAGTIGGNLVSAAPHYDAMPALLALDATATVADSASRLRTIALTELAASGALLVDIRVPATSGRLLADRSLHPAVAVYLGADMVADDIVGLRVAVGGAFACARVVVLPAGSFSAASPGAQASSLAQLVVEMLPEPLTDGLASAAYRRRMIGVLTRRLLIRLGSRA